MKIKQKAVYKLGKMLPSGITKGGSDMSKPYFTLGRIKRLAKSGQCHVVKVKDGVVVSDGSIMLLVEPDQVDPMVARGSFSNYGGGMRNVGTPDFRTFLEMKPRGTKYEPVSVGALSLTIHQYDGHNYEVLEDANGKAAAFDTNYMKIVRDLNLYVYGPDKDAKIPHCYVLSADGKTFGGCLMTIRHEGINLAAVAAEFKKGDPA